MISNEWNYFGPRIWLRIALAGSESSDEQHRDA